MDSWYFMNMDLAQLPSILLALAERRSLDDVLRTILEILVQQPDVGLARVWLVESDRKCPHCKGQLDEMALHLRASAGSPWTAGADWGRLTGSFHRVPVSSPLKLGHIARTGEPIQIPDLARDSQWVRYPEWVRSEGLASFAGRPLIFRGEVLGVLAVFRRVKAEDACWRWIGTLADAASVAVANARAFDEAEALRRELELERDYLREEVEEAGSFGEILGRSAALDRALRQVKLVAGTDANVLILGESGSGKELIARAIHQRSARARRPMVKVNCGSIPRELFESEFFGHKRGAFTGAIQDRVGRFQLADGGTLFLDEVGEIPLELQSKLLRVLQDGEFERVGEDVTRRVSVRVIAATNRDLRKEVAAGRFRLDLYYRLGVFPMEAPPLRERREDIPLLAAHFVRLACARFHVAEPRLPRRELERAQGYSWPGNVRELQNVVERAVILARGGTVSFELPESKDFTVSSPRRNGVVIPEREWRSMEKANILAAMEAAGGKVSGTGGAAELLGIHPATLASRLRVLGLRGSGRLGLD
ncbi:MAG: sigma 54-interacting transcriptional regulator [Bryobacteraceae bacterium]